MSSTSAGDKDTNKTVIETKIGAIENPENGEVSSWHSATQGSRKETSVANSRSSRRRKIDELELQNLRAKKKTVQKLQERQLEIEQEREEIELCRQQEEMRLQQKQQQREEELRLQQQQQQQQQREQELRLILQQQEDKLRLRQHERELENERKKAEADEEQRRLEIELTKGSSRASGSQAEDFEGFGSRHNLEKTAGWANSVAQQSDHSIPLS